MRVLFFLLKELIYDNLEDNKKYLQKQCRDARHIQATLISIKKIIHNEMKKIHIGKSDTDALKDKRKELCRKI